MDPCTLKFTNNCIVSPQTIIAVAFVNASNELGLGRVMWVTSGNDSVHARGSLHYEDRALDFRTKHLSTEEKHKLILAVKKRLGANYDVILEDEGGANEHAHLEYDPK